MRQARQEIDFGEEDGMVSYKYTYRMAAFALGNYTNAQKDARKIRPAKGRGSRHPKLLLTWH